MTRNELERRSATIARAMAISLNAPEHTELAQLVQAPGLHPITRCRLAYLRWLRELARTVGSLDELESRFADTMADALESILGIRSQTRTQAQRPRTPGRRRTDHTVGA